MVIIVHTAINGSETRAIFTCILLLWQFSIITVFLKIKIF